MIAHENILTIKLKLNKVDQLKQLRIIIQTIKYIHFTKHVFKQEKRHLFQQAQADITAEAQTHFGR